MSNNKYFSLPDIDDAPDTYETDQVVRLEPEEEPIKPSISRKDAISRFAKYQIDAANVDFDRNLGYDEAWQGLAETPDEKLARIRKELDMVQDKVGGMVTMQVIDEVKELQSRVQQVSEGGIKTSMRPSLAKLEERKLQESLMKQVKALREFKSTKPTNVKSSTTPFSNPSSSTAISQTNSHTYELFYTPEIAQQLAKSSQLEQRLALLERRLGILGEAGIMDRLNTIEHQMAFLTQPGNLEMITSKLAQLNFNQVKPPESLQQLSNNFTTLQPLISTLPHLMLRLKTLSTIHGQVGTMTSDISKIQQQQQNLETNVDNLTQVLDNLTGTMTKNHDLIRQNLQTLQQRLDQVLGTSVTTTSLIK